MPARTRLFRTVLALVSALVLLVSVTGWAASERYLSGLTKIHLLGNLTAGSVWNGQPTNILLVGSDDRSGLSERRAKRLHTGSGDFGRHTDTMMLVHLGGDLDNVSVVSIPRDSLVTIPAHTGPDGREVPEQQGKINSAFSEGGPQLTVATVEKATGLTIDHYVEVNFQGFLKMVDAVGGVDVCLSQPLQDPMSGLDLPAGRQTIHGAQALAYVRARYIDNDFGRSQRQQRFLAAMLQKVFSAGTLLNPVALNAFVDAAISSLTTDDGLDRDSIAALAARAADVDLGKVVFTSVPVVDGNHMVDGQSTVLWSDQEAGALFRALADDSPLPQPPKATPVEVPPDDISVSVTPGGSAGQTAVADLQQAGFQVTTATATDQAPQTTTITYDPAWPKSLATMQAAFPHATFVAHAGQGQTFAVAIGSDYAGLQPVRSQSTSVDPTRRTAKDNICDSGTAGQ